nr:hypothetical protein GCM10020063_038660 [Dactylosporangium thailandense]
MFYQRGMAMCRLVVGSAVDETRRVLRTLRHARRGARHGRVHAEQRQLHAELTTGPVSEARRIVGIAFEDPTRGNRVQLGDAGLQALYIVLWSFERIDVARDTLLGRWRWLALNPRRMLDMSIRRHVRMYLGYIERAQTGGQALVRRTDATTEAGIFRLGKRIGLDTARDADMQGRHRGRLRSRRRSHGCLRVDHLPPERWSRFRVASSAVRRGEGAARNFHGCQSFRGGSARRALQQSCTRRSIDFCSAWRQFDEECAFLAAAGVATPHRVRRR